MYGLMLALLGCQWLTAWDTAAADDRLLQAWNSARPTASLPPVTIDDALAAIERSRPARTKRILLFTAGWCGPCQSLAASGYPWLRAGGWRVDATDQAHVQTVDFDARPDLVRQYRIDRVPTAVLIREDAEVRRIVGPDRSQIVSLYND